MSVQRYINASFWDDEFITELDPSEKLMYMYLLTNPLTNIAGVYKITTKRICFDTGFNSNTVLHILEKFEQYNKIYKFNEYIIVKSWCKYQSWETSPKIKQGIIKTLKALPDEVIEFVYKINFAFDLTQVKVLENNIECNESAENTYSTDTISIEYDTVSNSTNYIDLNLNRDIDINSNTNSNTEPESKSKTNNKSKSFTKNDYNLAIKAYLDNYNLIKSKYSLSDSPTLDYKVITSMLKYNYTTFGIDKTVLGIKNSVNDKWILENGYRLTTILSSKIITRLIDNCVSKNNKTCFFEQATNDYDEVF